MKIVFIIFVCSLYLFSGSRVDDETLNFKISSIKLLNADGWVKNNTLGKWIKNDNLLSNNPVKSILEKSHIKQNFDYIQGKKIIYKNSEYFILLVERDTGLYQYPRIHRGWENFKITQAFVFTNEELQSIKDFIKEPNSNIFKIRRNFYLEASINDKFKILGGENAYTEEVLMSKISKIIKNFDTLSAKDSACCFNTFRIKSTIDDDKHIIRFKIPVGETVDSDLINSKYHGTNDINALDLEYFEVPADEFIKIFNI